MKQINTGTNIVTEPYERIDSLLIDDMKIIQDKRGFLFGTDSVMLSEFARLKKGDKVLDLCTGSGVIPLLLASKKRAGHIIGIEYFPEVANMARRSVSLNHLDSDIDIITGDIKDYKSLIKEHSVDLVTINPPYMVKGSGAVCVTDFCACARHEILCTLLDCAQAAEYALKFGGRLAMVHRTKRLAEVMYTLKAYKLEPKRMALIEAGGNAPPKLFLVEAVKGANPELIIEPAITPGEGRANGG